MDEKAQKKLDLLVQAQAKLKDVEHHQQALAEHLADLQMELMNANQNALCDRVSNAFSGESKNSELVKEILDDLEIQINQLRNE